MTDIIACIHLRRWIPILSTIVLLLALVGCTAGENFEQDEPTVVPQIFVVPTGTEPRFIVDESVPQNNCDGTAETSQTVERTRKIIYTLEMGNEISVAADGRVKIPEFGELGLGAEVASHYDVGYGREDSVSRSVKVAAKEGTNVQHTIRQYELWEMGKVIIVLGEISRELPYSFRRDFRIETLPPANIGDCAVSTSEEKSNIIEATSIPTPIPTVTENTEEVEKVVNTPQVIEEENPKVFGLRLCNRDAAGNTFVETDSSTGKTRIQILPSAQVFFISTDPSTITFSPNSGLRAIPLVVGKQVVIIGRDVPGLDWIELDPGFAFTACIYSSDQFARARSEADNDMNVKKAGGGNSDYYSIEGQNIELIETYP